MATSFPVGYQQDRHLAARLITYSAPNFWGGVLSTLFNVPDARSSLSLPAIVTKPGFSLCLNWRWLPFVLTMNQPSSSIILMTALTFMHRMISDLSRPCKEKHTADLICLRGQRILVPLRRMCHKPFAGHTLRVAEE